MLTVKILCIGKLKERYWREACEEYQKRLEGVCRFAIVELPESRLPADPSAAQIAAALEQEGEKILAAAGERSLFFPLCVEGAAWSSPELAEQIGQAAVAGCSTLCFIIGSSFGLSDRVKRKGKKVSLSNMTFPHQLARVMVCEQVYRAFQILQGGKYHK